MTHRRLKRKKDEDWDSWLGIASVRASSKGFLGSLGAGLLNIGQLATFSELDFCDPLPTVPVQADEQGPFGVRSHAQARS